MAHHCLLELAILSPIQYLERIKVTTIRRELTSNWLLRKSRTFISLLGSPPPIKQPPSNNLTPEGISCDQIWSKVSFTSLRHNMSGPGETRSQCKQVAASPEIRRATVARPLRLFLNQGEQVQQKPALRRGSNLTHSFM